MAGWPQKEKKNEPVIEPNPVSQEKALDMTSENKEILAPKAKQEENRPVVILSELDSIIAERNKTQLSNAPTLEDVQVRDLDKRTESQHRLKLPKEVEEAFIKRGLSPRWIYKEKRAIDNALNVIGWVLVNKVYFPELPDYLFSASGCIEAGDAILAFMSKRRAQAIREFPGKRSREMVRNIPAQDLKKWEQRSDNQYKPASGVAENGEDEKSTGRRGIVVTPDSDFGE